MRAKRILLVEDDPNDVLLFKASLPEISEKNEIQVTRNGVEALDYLMCCNQFAESTHNNPDIIVLDLNLPLMDGFEVLENVRSTASLQLIPVVGFSSSSFDLDIKKCFELGINSYVVKPMNFTQYKKTVRQMVNFWVDINYPPEL